jgi:hypothetical protein
MFGNAEIGEKRSFKTIVKYSNNGEIGSKKEVEIGEFS